MFRTRRAVDQQNAVRTGGVLMLSLRGRYGLAGGDPINRQLVVGIGKVRPGLSRVRALAGALVGVPGRFGDLVELDTKASSSALRETFLGDIP
jgi:hypothetical protein